MHCINILPLLPTNQPKVSDHSAFGSATDNMTSTTPFPCAVCGSEVRPRQQALKCDACEGWQHRTCDTGFSQDDYRHMVRGDFELLRWYCAKCPSPFQSLPGTPQASSTLLEDLNLTGSRQDDVITTTTEDVEMEDADHVPEDADHAQEDAETEDASHAPEDVEMEDTGHATEDDAIPTEDAVGMESLEESLRDPDPVEVSQTERAVEWVIVENSSRQRHPKLTSSEGFSYNVKRRNKNGTVDWQCCRRHKTVNCRATVKQNGEVFTPGPSQHCHPAEPGTTQVHKIRAAVVEDALNNVFRSAGQIVSKALRDPKIPEEGHGTSLPPRC